jgi:hypothetical protein
MCIFFLTHNRLKLLCPTRWVDRYDSIIIFLELFDTIVDSLSEVCTWLDKDASGVVILASYILGHVLSLRLPLSFFRQRI